MNERATIPFVSHLILSLLLLSSSEIAYCFGVPSAADAERAIQNRIKEQSSGRIGLTSFKKTDAVEGELLGVKFYSLEYQAEIEFLAACKWNITTFGGALMDTEANFHTSRLPDKPAGELAQFTEQVTNPGTEVSKGQRATLIGAVRFIKKESGWVAQNIQFSKLELGKAPETESIKPPARVPVEADKEILDALTEAERQYVLNFTPRPDSGGLQPAVGTAGFSTIRFAKFDNQQKTVTAVIKESGQWSTNSISLTGRIDEGQLFLQSENDSATGMSLVLARGTSGKFKSGQSAGNVTINWHDSYLLDADPRITDVLFWIKMRGNDVFRSSKYANDISHFPASNPVKDSRFVYVPSLDLKIQDFGKDKRIILFLKPLPSLQVVPIYSLDKVVRKVSPEELERLIKEQTGKSVADLVARDSSENTKDTADIWAEFDKLAPSTPKIQQAINFTTRGIKLGDTLSHVKKLFVAIQPSVSTNRINTDNVETEGHWVVKRDQGLQDAERVSVLLRGGRVSSMQVDYSHADVNKLGGWQTVLNELKDKLGAPDTDSRGAQETNGKTIVIYNWTIPESCGYIRFFYSSDPQRGLSVLDEYTKFTAKDQLAIRNSISSSRKKSKN